MNKMYRPGRAVLYLATSVIIEQALGLLALSQTVALSLVPGVFVAVVATLSYGQVIAGAVVLGMLYDAGSTLPFGAYMMAFLALGTTFKLLERYMVSGRLFPLGVFGLLALVIFYVALGFVRYLWIGGNFGWWYMVEDMAWNVVVLFILIYHEYYRGAVDK